MAERNRPSTIDRLPDEVRQRIADLRRNGRTIDEILDALKGLDVEVSRSALGRHVQSLSEIGDKMRRSEQVAKFVVEKFGDQPDEQIARATMRILQGGILELLTAERVDDDGAPIQLSIGEAKELALAMQRLVASQRMDTERQLKLRKAFAETAAAKAEEAAKAKGMSSDTVLAIRQAVLGAADG